MRPEGTLENVVPFHRALWHGFILKTKSSHKVAGKQANENMRPEGTLENLTTNIFHRI